MFGTLMLIAVPTVLFRLLGAFCVERFATWRVSVLHGLAVMLVFTASAHFVPSALGPVPGHHDLVAMVPPFVPFPASRSTRPASWNSSAPPDSSGSPPGRRPGSASPRCSS